MRLGTSAQRLPRWPLAGRRRRRDERGSRRRAGEDRRRPRSAQHSDGPPQRRHHRPRGKDGRATAIQGIAGPPVSLGLTWRDGPAGVHASLCDGGKRSPRPIRGCAPGGVRPGFDVCLFEWVGPVHSDFHLRAAPSSRRCVVLYYNIQGRLVGLISRSKAALTSDRNASRVSSREPWRDSHPKRMRSTVASLLITRRTTTEPFRRRRR